MALRVLIIEDDISFLTELRMELSSMDLMIHTEDSEGGAMTYLVNDPPDLVLLDLFLNHTNSGPILAKLINGLRIPYIVITQYREEEIFNEITTFKPLAFYSKPIDYLSLKYQINKLIEDLKTKEDIPKFPEGIYVRKKSSVIKIEYFDITFLQGEGNYVTIHTNGQKYVLRKSLKQITKELPGNLFIRIHRNYIANINKIKSIDFKISLVGIGNSRLPLGRSYQVALRQKFSK